MFTDFIQLSKAQQIEISNEKSEISKKKARSVRLTIPDVARYVSDTFWTDINLLNPDRFKVRGTVT